MPIYDIYSKRQQKTNHTADVYAYDVVPTPLRAQAMHIISDALETENRWYKGISDILCREYGFMSLPVGSKYYREDEYKGLIQNFVLNLSNYEQVLDVIEISLRIAENL